MLDTGFGRWYYGEHGEQRGIKGRDRMEKFWECYVEGTDGGRHYKWYSIEDARKEGERLAKLSNVQGKIVYLFECVGKCKVEQTPIKWEVPE